MMARGIGFLILLPALLSLPWAMAQQPVGRVGIFDLQKIGEVIDLGPGGSGRGGARKTKPGGNVGSEVKETGKPRQPAQDDQLQGKEGEEVVKKEIQRLSLELQKKGLSEEKRKSLEKELTQRRMNLSSLRNKAQREARDARAMENLRKRAMEALAGFAKEKGYIALFEKGFWDANYHRNAVLFAGGAKDVTEEAVEWLRAKAQSAEKQKKERGGQRR
jgi:Skp family chaperone for outer membrane proteins